jgi:hypothetical protein
MKTNEEKQTFEEKKTRLLDSIMIEEVGVDYLLTNRDVNAFFSL